MYLGLAQNQFYKFVQYILFIVLLITSENIFGQKFEKLALTPPMSWNNWNKFACNVNENLIRDAADAMVSSGMKDANFDQIY